jgi:hypothetical protein
MGGCCSRAREGNSAMHGIGSKVGAFSSILLTTLFAPFITACGASFCISTGFPPAITTFTPATIPANSGSVPLTIHGSNFGRNAMVVLPDGTELRPVSVDSSQLVVVLPANVIVTPGTLVIVVTDPCTGFGANVAVRITF